MKLYKIFNITQKSYKTAKKLRKNMTHTQKKKEIAINCLQMVDPVTKISIQTLFIISKNNRQLYLKI